MSKIKWITFKVKDGRKFGLPLELVAIERAKHYADEGDTDGEIDYVMTDSYQGIDWYLNNCNPEDFSPEYFTLIKEPPQLGFADLMRTGEDFEIEEIDMGKDYQFKK